ncbi:MAG: hypothetical protein IJD07_02915 [Clostridia bacterium]|nr:hypothetical protein [Clostridia bacterium]
MKNWILTLFTVNPLLERMTTLIDERVESLALSPIGNTLDKMENIISLNDKKVALINLRVMYESICKKLDEDEFALVKGCAFGKSVRDMSGYRSASTCYRKLNKAIKKAEAILLGLGYDEQKMDYYRQFPYIRAKLSAIKRRNKEGVEPIRNAELQASSAFAQYICAQSP